MTGFLKDFFTGDFSQAWQDIISAFKKLPKPVQDFIIKLESDEGQVLQSLASVAIQDVVAGEFTTASFVAAGKDVVAKALEQGKTVAMSDAMAQLNILATSLKPAA
jgi:hypothetical protein